MATVKNVSKQKLPVGNKVLKPGESTDVEWNKTDTAKPTPDIDVLKGWRKAGLIEVSGDKPSEQLAQGNFVGTVKD